MRLLLYPIESDRATHWRDDLEWLATRIDAAAHGLEPLGGPVLGRLAAAERIDGYVTAVLEDLEDRAVVGDIEDELFRFMRIVDGSEELRSALTSRDVSVEARRSLVQDLLGPRARPATVRLAAYVTEVGRPRDYEVLLAHLVDRVAAESNRRVAEVRAAIDLDDEQRRHLAGALNRIVGRDVEVRVTVDPAVLGGFVATIGDVVVDGSARHRLDLLKERLAMPEAQISTGDFN
jgi:F-type H+-transporting ATPase subunit delta